MSDPYLIIVILLFVLAISDLIVGVSNDAVNFLNSAVGSRVAPRNVIMIVASLGILVGATFSNGMMEVARKGVFNPEFFYFGEIMVIFLAVMLTDIILLDLFNTIGLPTSTTVSIVFELLGAAVMMALIKLADKTDGLSAIGDYINSSQALMIISGIFLSVIFAFLIGVLVQFVSRLLLSFHFRERAKFIGLIWCAVAMTTMTYFLLFKGIKGTSFASAGLIEWVTTNVLQMVGIAFAAWLAILFLLKQLKVDQYRVVVLFGTFSLAMAFAGNDLVNFIGVPIAGFESYLAWSQTGQDAFEYSMGVLKEPVRTKTYLLVISGLIMIVTLWLSKKARSVTETEVNLGRQDEGHERFTPNRFAQSLVSATVKLRKMAVSAIPNDWLMNSAQRFEQVAIKSADKPAFDLVRAGVNLTTASILIAFATSLKLPLSTTYVSFMVAMGTSLADQAWGRDSAVYRVAGVLNVIGGWFATAIIAFLVSGVFTLLIFNFNFTAIAILLALAIFFIYHSFSYHRKKERKKESRIAFETSQAAIERSVLFGRINRRITGLMESLIAVYEITLTGLIKEDKKLLKKGRKAVRELQAQNEDFQFELFQSIKRIEEPDSKGSRLLLYVFDLEQDILQSAELVVSSARNHVRNVMKPLKPEQRDGLQEMFEHVQDYFQSILNFLNEPGEESAEVIIDKQSFVLSKLEQSLSQQVKGIKGGQFGSRNSQLIFKILLETEDIINISARFIQIYRRAKDGGSEYVSFRREQKST